MCEWSQTRNGQIALSWGLISMLVGWTLIATLRAQYSVAVVPAIEQARKTQELTDQTSQLAHRAEDMDGRLTRLEHRMDDLRLDSRLSVLEERSSETGKTVNKIVDLGYAGLASVAGLIGLHIFNLKKKGADA